MARVEVMWVSSRDTSGTGLYVYVLDEGVVS